MPRLYRGTRQGRIISTVDPEMRHGRKSSQQRFDGYKLSAAVTNSSEPLITAVDVCPAGETDGPQAKHLIDSQPPEQRPERILGDTAYGNGPVRAELAERDVDVLAPVPEGKIVEGRVRQARVPIDLDAGTVTCPGGHTVRSAPPRPGSAGASFAAAICGDCPLKARCCPGTPARQINLRRHTRTCSWPAVRRSPIRPPPSTYDAPDRGSNGSWGCSPTATAPARAATSAAPRPDCRPHGPPRWSTSTRSPASWPLKRPRNTHPGARSSIRASSTAGRDQLTHPRRSTREQPTMTITNSRNVTSSGVF